MANGLSIWQKREGLWVAQLTYKYQDGSQTKFQRRRSTRSLALEAVRELETKLQEKEKREFNETFERLFPEFIAHKQSTVRANTAADYKHQLQLYVLPKFAKLKVSQIKAKDVIALLQGLKKSGLSASTVNTVRLRLSAFMEYALVVDQARENPCRKVKSLQRDSATQVQKPWTKDEVLKALAVSKGTGIELFLHLALFLGLRKGEILALRWGDVRLDEGFIEITKTRSHRRVISEDGELHHRHIESPPKTVAGLRRLPLSAPLLVALMNEKERQQALGRPCDEDQILLRGAKGQPLAPSSLTKAYNAFCEANSLRRIRIHDLRHTAIVQALEGGARLEEASQGAGHASTEVTQKIYAVYVQRFASGFTNVLADRLSSDNDYPTGSLEEVG